LTSSVVHNNRIQPSNRPKRPSPSSAPGSGTRIRFRPLSDGTISERSEDEMAVEGSDRVQATHHGDAVQPAAREDTVGQLAELMEPTSATEERRGALHQALAGIREDLGFATATVYVGGPGGWHIMERDGATRPWHGVLDPVLLDGADQAIEYLDVRAIPRVGDRLASLGCASVAMLPLPYGGRLLLDSGAVAPSGGWIERVRPYLELIGIMAGPSLPAESALQGHEEVAALDRVFMVCQDAVSRPGSTIEDLLAGVRDAIRADELFVVSDRGADLEVIASPACPLAAMSRDEGVVFDAGTSLGEDLVRLLALNLGASSRVLAGAVGRGEPFGEMLMAGWAEGPALTPVSTGIVARAVSTARSALQNRLHAVTTLFDEERSRLAYAIHDDLTQTVTGAVLELEALGARIERDPKEAIGVLERSKTEIRRALADLRATLFDLSQTGEEARQAAAPLTRYVEDVVRRWRLPARVAVEGNLTKVPPRVLSVAYTVIREALTNAAKHSTASNVTVSITAADGELTVMVGDAGRGFTPQQERAAREDNHFGLGMLRKRVAEVGGRIQIESQPGVGTRVLAQLPIGGVGR
jgi:signal transduction histidine kinase